MEPICLTNYTELQHRIMQLKSLRVEQEEEIKRNIKEIYYSLNPSVLVKNMLREFVGDEARHSVAKSGINAVADFLIGKLFGRGNSIKGYLSSLLIGKISNFILNNYSDALYAGISKIRNRVDDYFHKNHF